LTHLELFQTWGTALSLHSRKLQARKLRRQALAPSLTTGNGGEQGWPAGGPTAGGAGTPAPARQ